MEVACGVRWRLGKQQRINTCDPTVFRRETDWLSLFEEMSDIQTFSDQAGGGELMTHQFISPGDHLPLFEGPMGLPGGQTRLDLGKD